MVTKEEGEELAKFYGIDFFESSAKNTINIEESFIKLSKTIIENMNKHLEEDNINLDSKNKVRKNIREGCC